MTYTEKEKDLVERYEKTRNTAKKIRSELEALKYWSR